MNISRRLLFIVFDQFELLDLSGPSAVFNAAQTLLKDKAYECHVLSSRGGMIDSRGGIQVNTCLLESFSVCGTDTLMIVGGSRAGIEQASKDHSLRKWLVKNSYRVERTSSVCSGAMILAANGILDGKQATTHWADLNRMQQMYPKVLVKKDALYCTDEHVWTSAGVTTGIDMALAMVGEDYGHGLMQQIAEWLVVYAHRPGNQSQFSGLLQAQTDGVFAKTILWIEQHIQQPLKVADMAVYSAMTERTFFRKFSEKVGCSPAKYLEQRRLLRAKQLLQNGISIKVLHSQVGYQSELGFRKAFQAEYGVSPALYRRMHCKKV